MGGWRHEPDGCEADLRDLRRSGDRRQARRGRGALPWRADARRGCGATGGPGLGAGPPVNLAVLLELVAALAGDRVAAGDGRCAVTYEELLGRARRWAAWIAAR